MSSIETEFDLSNDIKAEKINGLLPKLPDTDIVIFTDGSGFTNPGPTGDSAIIDTSGLRSEAVCLKRRIITLYANWWAFNGELALSMT